MTLQSLSDLVAAVTALPARSFLIDGEAIVTNADGLAVFDLIRHKVTATLRCSLLSI